MTDIGSRRVSAAAFVRGIARSPESASEMLAASFGAASGFYFTMTAGQIPATTWGGYQAGDFGSIDRQPIEGTTLTFCATDQTGGSITFSGDHRAILQDLNLYVDGVLYDVTWDFNGSTYALLSTRIFFNGEVYFVEIK